MGVSLWLYMGAQEQTAVHVHTSIYKKLWAVYVKDHKFSVRENQM